MIYVDGVHEQLLDSDGEPIEDEDQSSMMYEDALGYQLAPDGFPRYYLKKPPGDPQLYAFPIPPDVILDEVRLLLEPKWKKRLRHVIMVFCWLIMRLVDLLIARWFVNWVPRLHRMFLFGNAAISWKIGSKCLIKKPPRPWMLRFTTYTINLIYYPLIITSFLEIFFLFDDRIDGLMFHSNYTQQVYKNIRQNTWQIVYNDSMYFSNPFKIEC
ncbi:Protein CBG26036 [Caenorhabditis briggsae]|uniref:Transmembrane protein n=2 Tax=Caenorhabditis briggsae TaxID=6238 RepID=A0AAE9DF98_CAEBR|nr:Protein CBG26036 [Caenorhabditis briggsae]ULU02710.1 hypothetical protein L3Y34_002361 [Caenorhabditis briggsae]CAR99307.1 Protein CBG26036 [Caenorhabditis briggsae]